MGEEVYVYRGKNNEIKTKEKNEMNIHVKNETSEKSFYFGDEIIIKDLGLKINEERQMVLQFIWDPKGSHNKMGGVKMETVFFS
mmetsp:Transcript_24314/g.29413  ORF Transcript_24314/g.29413 Transcript_24314/m.29413 type:complete len:84 (+) Transcript_24314:108-359(+)